MRKLEINKEFTEKFNKMRIAHLDGQYNMSAVKDIIKKELDIYVSSTWVKYLIQYKIINPVKHGKRYLYTFSTSPIHKEKLNAMYSDILKYNKDHKKRKEEIIEEIEVLPLNPIEEAIALLKENGYRIYRQIVRFEEV